jgi:hypothetical protein
MPRLVLWLLGLMTNDFQAHCRKVSRLSLMQLTWRQERLSSLTDRATLTGSKANIDRSGAHRDNLLKLFANDGSGATAIEYGSSRPAFR